MKFEKEKIEMKDYRGKICSNYIWLWERRENMRLLTFLSLGPLPEIWNTEWQLFWEEFIGRYTSLHCWGTPKLKNNIHKSAGCSDWILSRGCEVRNPTTLCLIEVHGHGSISMWTFEGEKRRTWWSLLFSLAAGTTFVIDRKRARQAHK